MRAEVPTHHAQQVINRLVHLALSEFSVALPRPRDIDQSEPAGLQRSDGTSVYEVAGSALCTSTQVLQAEQYLLQIAAQLSRGFFALHVTRTSALSPGVSG